MRRLAAVDWLLIGTLLPICLFGVVMSVVHGIRGDFVRPPFFPLSAPDAQSYPVVSRVFSWPGAEAPSVAVGDRVLRLEGEDLAGVSFAGFAERWSAAARTGMRSLRFTIERGRERSEVHVPLVPSANALPGTWWGPLPVIAAFVGTALILVVRAPHWHLVRRAYVTSLLLACWFMPYFQVPTAPRVAMINSLLVFPLSVGLTLWSVCEFVPGVRLWGPFQRALTWTLSLIIVASFAALFWLPDAGLGAFLTRSGELAMAGSAIAILVTLTLAYRRADALGRRQIKWAIYGDYVGIVPGIAFLVAYAFDVQPEWITALGIVSAIALVAIPLGLLVAIAFYHFLDIDRLFSATLTYSVLLFLGVAIVLGVMPTAAHAASRAFGLDPASGQLLLSFGLAAAVVPAQRIVRPRIDRMLFPERVTLEQGFEQLLGEISSSANMQELTRLVGERLDGLLRPTAVVLYARAGEVFTPVVVRGRTASPAFAVHSGLIATLQECTTPLAAERWTARRTTSLTPFERAAIETLDVAILVPIRRGADLVAFSCLGPKRSGDIYTPTDLALLGAVAGKISDRLLAIEAAAVAEQARAMQEALRRYVPGAVAERIVSGQDLKAGEREVTVLFVDIRGYTGFSEPREAEEIFRTVNRYTETVSTLVQARGGVIVEFHGDGMLAVFGAPEELQMKEYAAVQAARDIVVAISTLPAPDGGGPGLTVGVGIATGPTFVGNIQSADRAIWTVIGNTVNLAARLQSLTRDLDAAVAIDDTTFRRTSRTCSDFVRHGDLAIRGRTGSETVHALPLVS